MRWIARLAVAALIVAAAALLPQARLDGVEDDDLTRILGERDALKASNAALQAEIEQLRAEIHALETDPAELERVAREDLNMIRPGQHIFEVRTPEPGTPARALGRGGPQ
jgi:cell division protein FtsB